MLPALKQALVNAESDLHALKSHMACIEFDPQGNILAANPPFLQTVGYTWQQLEGQHHRLFCPKHVSQGPEYAGLWRKLSSGQSVAGTFERINAQGQVLWLEATYFPVKDAEGRVCKVIKIANVVQENHQLLKTLTDNTAGARESAVTGQDNINRVSEIMTEIYQGAESVSRAASRLGNLG